MTSIFYERDLRIPSLLNLSHGSLSTDVSFMNICPRYSSVMLKDTALRDTFSRIALA